MLASFITLTKSNKYIHVYIHIFIMSKNLAFPIQQTPKPHENSSRTPSMVKILFNDNIVFLGMDIL